MISQEKRNMIKEGHGLCMRDCPFFKLINDKMLNAMCALDSLPLKYYDGFLASCTIEDDKEREEFSKA